jgi:hypothetical protein
MSGAIPPLLQYAFMAWCSVKAQGQLYLYLYHINIVSIDLVSSIHVQSFLTFLDLLDGITESKFEKQ